MEILAECGKFLQQRLPHDPAFTVKPTPPSEMTIKELKAAVRNCGLASQAVGFYEKAEFVKLLEEYYANK